MQPTKRSPFRRGRAEEWTRERIERLAPLEIRRLMENAERLEETELAELCATMLKEARKTGNGRRGATAQRPAARHLVSRAKAFEARGVRLQDARTSWGGRRHTDGEVVMALWSAAIEPEEGGCRYLLWAPNVEGSRPWSDMPAGRERRQHCELALERGSAHGLLVLGEALKGHLPEEKAQSIYGIDPEASFRFKVEKRGEAYWAVWGKKPQE